MPKGLDGTQSTATAQTLTKPYFLVYMGFLSPVRLSTAGSITWDSFNWRSADMTVDVGVSVAIFNETTLLGQLVLDEGTAGKAVKIYMGYRNDTAHPNPLLVFDGELGNAQIGNSVVIRCKRNAPLKTPRHYAVPPILNHMPPDGTRFDTPKQTIILERE